jgi:hypothetical protein
VACVEEACKEPVQKIRENAGMRKAEERMKERETAVGVEKSKENLCMWKNNIMRWNQDGRVVEVRERESSGCEKRRRRICVTGEEAENGLQRTVRQSSRSETVKNTE